MIFRSFLVFVLMICAGSTKSQFYFYDNEYFDKPVMFELGGSMAFFNGLTDIGGHKGIGKKFLKDLNVNNTQIGGSVYLNATYMSALTLRMEASFGQVKGYDSILKSVAPSTYGRYERNLSFKTSIMEGMLVLEVHPLFIFRKFDSDKPVPRISPYVLGGIGYYHFEPTAKLFNNWVSLQPLHLEGQGFNEYSDSHDYSLNQINIPLGAGLRYELSRIINVRLELIYRVLATDYLDDVSHYDYINPNTFRNHLTGSKLTNALLLYDRRTQLNPANTGPGQRGNPDNTDAYFTLNFKLGLTFGRERMTNASGRRK